MADLSSYLTSTRSARIFNRVRQEHSRTPTTFLDVNLQSWDLASHNLSHARFSKCYFENVNFGALENVEFADCQFKSCHFDDLVSEQSPSLKGVLFYLCTFEKTDFDHCHLQEIRFAKSAFLTTPKFLGSRAKGTIRIDKSGGWKTFKFLPDLDLQTNWETNLRTDLPAPSRWRLSWETVRVLQHIPFLQTSLIGLLLLVTQISIVEFYLYLASEPQAACKNLLQQMVTELAKLPELSPELVRLESRVSEWCTSLSATKFTTGTLVSIAESTAMFVLLFLAALVHKIRGPSEIYEYSANEWKIEHSRPELYYKIIGRRNPVALFITILLYGICLISFFYLFVFKLIYIYRYIWIS
jgi:hypothetical protein